MHVTIRLLSVLLLGIAMGSQALYTQTRIPVPAELAAQVAADGSALVIVGVRAAFVPEGTLAGTAEVAAQRDAMHAAVDAAMGRAAAAGAVVGTRFETIPFFTARVNDSALAALAAQADVASIELDALDAPTLAQSVPLVNAPAAWTAGHTGAGWTVAILDTGVEKTHGFLAGKVATTASEACYSNAGGSGGRTSLCPGGVNASTSPGSGVNCSSSIEGCYHGTHVAGIATGFNGTGGINGVAPGAQLLAIQVFTRFDDIGICGSADPCVLSFTSDQILALERVLAVAGPGNLNRIASVNMSLGGGRYFGNCDADQASRKAAIDNLRSVGIATVIASGNNGYPDSVSAPACISTAISVGSTTKSDLMSSFSNRRPGLISLLAPGSTIYASLLNNTFGTLSGTSMATPHVAGAWAVIKQAVPTATVTQALTAFQSTGVVINDASSGGSYLRINVNAARLALLGGGAVPGAPGTPTIGGAGNTVNINWTAPTTGGAPTGYTVIARLSPGGPVIATLPVGNVLATSVAAPNGTFHVTVQAANASGPGPESAGITFNVPIVEAPPGAPVGLGVTVIGSQATFTWTPPTTGGTATGYVLAASLSSGGPVIAALPFAAPASSIPVSGIAPGTYFVRLAATNAGGTGPFSNEVVVTVAGPQAPGAPTMNPASVAGSMVTLSWAAPTTGGAPTSYLVVASLSAGGPPIATLPVGGLGITVPAASGTYFVRVHGVNAIGQGPASNTVTVVVP